MTMLRTKRTSARARVFLQRLVLPTLLLLIASANASSEPSPSLENGLSVASAAFRRAAISNYELALRSGILPLIPDDLVLILPLKTGGFLRLGPGALRRLYLEIPRIERERRQHSANGWSVFLDSVQPRSPKWSFASNPVTISFSKEDIDEVQASVEALRAYFSSAPQLRAVAEYLDGKRPSVEEDLDSSARNELAAMPEEFAQRYRFWQKNHFDFKVALCFPSGGSHYSAGIGANAGISYNRRLSHELELCNELLFSIRSLGIEKFAIDIDNARELDLYSVDYIPSVKLAVGHYLYNHLYLLGGIEIRKLISAKVVAGKGYASGDAGETEDIDVSDEVDAVAYGINLGAGFVRQTQRGWLLKAELRYGLGMSTKLYDRNDSVNTLYAAVGFGSPAAAALPSRPTSRLP